MSIISPIVGFGRTYKMWRAYNKLYAEHKKKKKIGSVKKSNDELYKEFMALDKLLNQIIDSRYDYQKKGMQYEMYKMQEWETETMNDMQKIWNKLPKYLKEKIDRNR